MSVATIWAIASAASGDISAMRGYLPRGIRICNLADLAPRREPAVIVLDLQHPAASRSELLCQVEEHPGSGVFLLSASLKCLEDWPLSRLRVNRVLRHPATAAGFKEIVEKIIPFAEPAATPVMVSAEAGDAGIRVLFGDGRAFQMPTKRIEGLDRSRILRVRLGRQGHDFEIVQDSGNRVALAWDIVLHHCDPGYEYYRGKRSPSSADHIAANVRTWRAQKGMTSYELARRTGIHRPNIARIENATNAPSLPTLERIARALGIPVARLLD